MTEVEAMALSLIAGVTAGAIVWEWLRGDLMPRLWNNRNEARLRALTERLARLEDQLAAA